MSDVKAIADGLTRAQAAAMRGVYAWQSPWDQDEGERELVRMGLWKERGGLTPLGLAVREYLERQNNDR